MSFLNPVNKPVKRFKSTDAGAPSLNFVTRKIGDVKDILKACLVTGYGAIEGAGWEIAGETASYGEFTSPSANMAGIALRITDTATIPTWQQVVGGTVIRTISDTKVVSGINATHASNGWQVIVTELGFFYIEMLYSTIMEASTARLYFFGLMKSAITADPYGSGLWATGWNINSSYPISVMKPTESNPFFYIDTKKSTNFYSAAFISSTPVYGVSNIDIASDIYININDATVGQHIGLMAFKPALTTDMFPISEKTIDGRPVLYVSLSNNYGSYSSQVSSTRYVLIFLDYWEC